MSSRRRSRNGNGITRKQFRSTASALVLVLLLSASVAITTLRPFASEALAQQDLHMGHAAAQTPEPLVDGSVQPELVPDDVAIRMLMRALRVPTNPDSAALKRLSARVGGVNLGDADFEIVVREMGVFDVEAKEQEARIEAVRPSAEADSVAITRFREEQEELRSLMVVHYQRLLVSLSPEGSAKLRDHLGHVKSRVKIYPMPEMPGEIAASIN